MGKGATRLTSVLENCGTPRGDSTYPHLSDNSVAAGDGGGSENTFAKKLCANVASTRILLDNSCNQQLPAAPTVVQSVVEAEGARTSVAIRTTTTIENGEGFSLYFKLRGDEIETRQTTQKTKPD